ncbi:hypothetical protein CHLRE_08g381483v5 [Chlamydomonas reinhardtii]|uniref:Uncharacterized protein n=1 Tax=Chlamydomonas reinhardtii TaxID=3055 RepID=A0A2K3DI23_CHLRE|nr:uncharacterized protein CHLRE_08g381483v5 [Chlamydomonas reinhardtii]PNW80183.1 hypothetical protein CHLRE_08g381483v5 [Chlamydomonas reinhardtii]
MAGHLTVEERLEKARLMPRVSPELLQLVTQTDKLLLSSHQSNLSQAIIACQEIAREAPAVVVALRWTVTLVDLLESDIADVRLAACNALAAVSVAQEGRDAIRTAGGLRPLVLLLGGGCGGGGAGATTAAAALALMNCSACDVCKAAIADCHGVPMLLNLIREAVARTHAAAATTAATTSGASSTAPAQPQSGTAAAGAGAGGAAAHGGEGLKTPGDCRAAGYAAGALMNMGGVADVQDRMLEAGAVEVFEEAVRAAAPGDLVSTRAQFCLSWLAVGSGGAEAAADGEVQPPPPEPLTQPPPGAGLVPGGGGSGRRVPVASPRYPSASGAAPPSAAASLGGRSTPSGGGGASRTGTPLAGAAKPAAGSALAAVAAARGTTPLGGGKPGAAAASAR